MTDASTHIADLLTPTVESLGFELVRVTYGGGRKPTLQIMAERPDGTMSVDDCATLSREVSALMDVEDPLDGEYLLEVSSPGIDRPLTRRKDFERWTGFEAKVEMVHAIDDRRRFRGRLISLTGNDLIIDTDEGQVVLDYSDLNKAKLLLTDELMDAVQNSQPEDGE